MNPRLNHNLFTSQPQPPRKLFVMVSESSPVAFPVGIRHMRLAETKTDAPPAEIDLDSPRVEDDATW